jgi:hypothetical protein
MVKFVQYLLVFRTVIVASQGDPETDPSMTPLVIVLSIPIDRTSHRPGRVTVNDTVLLRIPVLSSIAQWLCVPGGRPLMVSLALPCASVLNVRVRNSVPSGFWRCEVKVLLGVNPVHMTENIVSGGPELGEIVARGRIVKLASLMSKTEGLLTLDIFTRA